jgi:hypothetical protein
MYVFLKIASFYYCLYLWNTAKYTEQNSDAAERNKNDGSFSLRPREKGSCLCSCDYCLHAVATHDEDIIRAPMTQREQSAYYISPTTGSTCASHLLVDLVYPQTGYNRL